jgi:hypothetical protein
MPTGGTTQTESGGGGGHCTVTVFGASIVIVDPLGTVIDCALRMFNEP